MYKLKILDLLVFLTAFWSQGICQNSGNNLSSEDTIKYFNPALNAKTDVFSYDTVVEKMPDSDSTIKTVIIYRNGLIAHAEVYYPTGQKHSDGFYNSVEDSDLFEIGYFKNGDLKYISYNDNYSRVLTLQWNRSGQVTLFIDARAGNDIEWYDDGNIKSTVTKIKDVENGEIIKNYYENGQLQSKVITNSGIQEYNHYYDTGMLKHHGHYLNTTMDRIGKWFEYYENGMMKREYNFSLETPEIKDGIWCWWDESGNLIKKEIYKNGKLISSIDIDVH